MLLKGSPGCTVNMLLKPESTTKERVGLLLPAILSFLAKAKA